MSGLYRQYNSYLLVFVISWPDMIIETGLPALDLGALLGRSNTRANERGEIGITTR